MDTVLRRETLADRVASGIVELIDENALRPGDVLPAEGEFASRFGVSRLVVREAIRTLAAREVVSSGQGRPARVAVPSARVFGQLLDFRVRQESLDLLDVLETRRLLEVELAGRAAARTDVASIAAAEAILTAMSRSTRDRDQFIDLDIELHEWIAERAESPTMHLVLASLETVLRRARETSWDGRVSRRRSHRTTLRAHTAIVEAIAARDPAGARAAMERHIEETGADLRYSLQLSRRGPRTPR